MAQYMLLVYSEEVGAAEQAEREHVTPLLAKLHKSLREAGVLVGVNRLHSTESATSVRVRDGNTEITDGPFAITKEVLAGYYEPDDNGRRRPESLYGSLKMWAHLNREGIEVARCTVERLMRLNGWAGVTRGRRPQTTIADPETLESRRPPDLVERQFAVPAPNLLWVADFTYVARIGGRWCYTAFTIDAFADTVVGWQTTPTADAAMVHVGVFQSYLERAD